MTIERPMFPPRAESVDSFIPRPAANHRPNETPPGKFAKTAKSLSRRMALIGLAALPAALPAAAAEPDPIFAAIERHRAAAAVRSKAVRIEFAFEEDAGCVRDMNAEQRQHYDTLEAATAAAWDHLDDAGRDLVNTKPATLAGIVALCRYLEPMLNDPSLVDLPESVCWDDGTESTVAGAFANVVAAAAKALIEGARQ